MVPENWNKENYKKFIEYLISIKDEEYKKFHSSLVLNSRYEMIGIRLPIMRKIAKEISKTDIEEFLKYSQNKYYEEIMIQGLVISSIKNEEKFYKYFKNHITKIDNWALCDTFCNSIKIVKKYEEKYFPLAIEMCLNEDEFISRIGLVTILSHFVEEKNLKEIFEMLNKIKSDKFYINMAQAWLVCELYIKHPKETMGFIKQNNLNKFTHNKAISKIHDSYRVSKEDKDYLNGLRIR
ncbi:MAG: DNA alkylation repair protein [Clostridia bacterium]|nr:DNA alkylation repair protein [Clostridia bacterium]